jgi:cytochrome c556
MLYDRKCLSAVYVDFDLSSSRQSWSRTCGVRHLPVGPVFSTFRSVPHHIMKSRTLRRILVFSLPALGLTACGPAQDTAPGQPVAHRQQAFKEILRRFEPMGVTLRENRYEPERFLQQAVALDQQKAAPWNYFGPETNYPPSKSKDAVWTDAQGFSDEREAFLKAVEQLRLAAETKEIQKVSPAYEAVQSRCRSCHKAFKAR